MKKVILFTGSLSYTAGKDTYFKNKEYTVTDEQLNILPKGSYKLLKVIKEEPKKVEVTQVPEIKEEPKKFEDMLLPEMKEFYLKNSIAKLKEYAHQFNIEIPPSVTLKNDIFVFMLDNGFTLNE